MMSILLIAFLGMSQAIGSSMAMTEVNRESALATDGARGMVEILQGVEDFSTVFALYNADPNDDPGPPGSAPGAAFTVAGLAPVPGDGLVGEILFPTLVGMGGGLELRETHPDADLWPQRDLNGDGDVDLLDHSGDYRLLPVVLRLRWTASTGERSSEIRTLLADR